MSAWEVGINVASDSPIDVNVRQQQLDEECGL